MTERFSDGLRAALGGFALFAVLLILRPLPASSHPLAPSLLELRERGGGVWTVLWKTPLLAARGSDPRPRLPTSCRQQGDGEARVEADALRVASTLRCDGSGLDGTVVGVDGLAPNTTTALLRVVQLGGRIDRWLLTGENPAVVLAPAGRGTSTPDLALRFARLGANHLLAGTDHLAFLLGLFLLVRRRRTLVLAVTAFTLGHSITLSLALFGLFPMGPQLVEVGIAASIVLVAAEILHGGAGLFARRPWAATFGFGLLHGAGFAAGLRDAGLTAGEIPVALASFNAGIEAAQMLFLAALLIGSSLLRRLPLPATTALRNAPAYAIGAVAAFWLFDRLAGLL